MSWPEAMALKQRLGSFEALSDSMPVTKDNMTASVRNDVLELRSEAELLQYLRSSSGQLGHMHNTAYVLFTKFMGLLEAPESPWGEKTNFDRKMSVREILQLYLYRDLIPVTNRKNKDAQSNAQLTPQQKAMLTQIRAGWPDESELSRMKSRESDVTRKVLILLFLATDGAGLQFSKKAALANRPVNHAAICRDSIARVNRMLGGCGYCLLDARSPFDWIVIYWLSVDAIEDTDLRMAQSLTALFSGSEKQEQPAE